MPKKTYSTSIQMSLEDENIFRVIESVSLYLDVDYNNINIVKDNPEYFSKDIDFITPDEQTWEVKVDFYDSGYCFLETISNTKTGALGWLLISKADWLVYAFPELNKFYVANMSELRNWFLLNIDLFNKKHRRQVNNEEDGYAYKSWGYVVSLDGLEDRGLFKKYRLHTKGELRAKRSSTS